MSQPNRNIKAVILAGGLGSRLRPFTEAIPKPLLPIGEKSLLEIQISRLQQCGVTEVFLATNYKSEYIGNFFGDGNRLGVKLHISKEEIPLGTCGPIKLLEKELREPFLLMNGDILTTAKFDKIFDFALSLDAPFSVVTKEIVRPFDFGKIESKGDYILSVEEKPDLKLEILAGIYFCKPEVLQYIPENEYFGIDHLIKKLISLNIPIGRYLLTEYWLDIGRVEDYQMAESAYNTHFK